jgi:hypothetical protein
MVGRAYEWGVRTTRPANHQPKCERNARLELIDEQLSDYDKPRSAWLKKLRGTFQCYRSQRIPSSA